MKRVDGISKLFDIKNRNINSEMINVFNIGCSDKNNSELLNNKRSYKNKIIKRPKN